MINDRRQITEDLKTYLLERHSVSTVKIYLFDINHYIEWMGKERAEEANYREVMDYVSHLRREYHNTNTIRRTLYGIKAWYFYLIDTGQRQDHPCRYLRLRDAKSPDIQLQDLFTSNEMEKLMQRKERYPLADLRNKAVISLLIYQGLRIGEITRLRLRDIDLEAGEIYIRSTPVSQARKLKLKARQVMIFYKYIHQVRPRLLKTKPETEPLILTLRGTPDNGEGINYLVETFKPLFPERNLNATTIRQSVIANLLSEGKDLRAVQAFAGHKKISSTEKYRQTGLKELQEAIDKYHPLG